MPSVTPPEDLHAILSRFHTWAGNQAPNGHGNGSAKGTNAEEIREIPYEEAIRRHRSRQAARTVRRATPPKSDAETPTQPKPSPHPAPGPSEAQEDLPTWAAGLPIVSGTESVIDLAGAPYPEPPVPIPAHGTTRAYAPSRTRKPSPGRKPQPETIQSILAALPELAAPPDPPPSAPASRPRPRATAPPAPRAKAAFAAPPPSRPAPPPAGGAAVRIASASGTPAASAMTASASRPHPRPDPRPDPRPARVQPRAGLIASPLNKAAKVPVSRAAVRRTGSPPAAKSRPRAPKKAQFSQILASTVQQPKTVLALKKKSAQPDRTRRITTRFSRAEERRIEKCAAEMGITVSAYLRECALSAVAHDPPLDLPGLPAPIRTRKALKPSDPAPAFTTLTPPPSLFGGWLSLLRNRFLGPPIRFSEDA